MADRRGGRRLAAVALALGAVAGRAGAACAALAARDSPTPRGGPPVTRREVDRIAIENHADRRVSGSRQAAREPKVTLARSPVPGDRRDLVVQLAVGLRPRPRAVTRAIRRTGALLLALLLAFPAGARAGDDDGTYWLPVPGGWSIHVSQGNGGGTSHHDPWSRDAYDLAWQRESFPVVASRAGTVLDARSESDSDCHTSECWTDANFVLVDHGDGTTALYQHLAPDTARVRRGDRVRVGDLLGMAGETGYATGIHLHIQLERTADVLRARDGHADPGATPPPGWSQRDGWWVQTTIPFAFSDPSVTDRYPDGHPVGDESVELVSANPGPFATDPRVVGRPRDIPARLPWAPGETHAVIRAWDPAMPDGYGMEVAGPELTRSTRVYPLFGGRVLFAGCAGGSAAGLGRTVVVEATSDDGHRYAAVYAHLSGISALVRRRGRAPLDRPLGTMGTTSGARCADAGGDPHLHVGVWRDAAIDDRTGEVRGGTPVRPEPLLGSGLYEKLTWWRGEPLTATAIVTDVGTPGGSWTDATTPDGGRVTLGRSVDLVARVHDPVALQEVRLTGWYPGWADRAGAADLVPGFDPNGTWRVLAICRPPGSGDRWPTTDGSCTWSGDAHDATVTYRWDPRANAPAVFPWSPAANPAITSASRSCVTATLSFDVFDTAGYRSSAPNGLRTVELCPR